MTIRWIIPGLLLACSGNAAAFDLGNLVTPDQMHQLEQAGANALAPGQTGAPAAHPGSSALDRFSATDQSTGLRQALTQGAQTAVSMLEKPNGYLDNQRVRIPLPGNLQRAQDVLSKMGMGSYGDQLVASMNHAAEAAVPQAEALLVDAVRSMSIDDARKILTGGNDAATQYFRARTGPAIAARFKPIVSQAMSHVGVAKKYDQFAGLAAQTGLVPANDATLEDYVTNKAMDGLFLMMADEEKNIRAHPMQAAGSLARSIFSALR